MSHISSDKTAFAPAKTKRACEVIYDQIYDKIVRGELEAGDRLPPERVLAEQFQRSRPSVREALRMLQQNGLIRIDIGSAGGSIVQGFSVAGLEKNLKDLIDSGVFSLQELKDYRIINDMGCARLAARNRTARDIAALERTSRVTAPALPTLKPSTGSTRSSTPFWLPPAITPWPSR